GEKYRRRLESLHFIDLYWRNRQPLARRICDDVRILHTHSAKTGIENLWLNGQHDTRLKRRVELWGDHRYFVQLETHAGRDEPDLVLCCSHEMGRERCFCHTIENILINLARNVPRPELVFDPGIELEDVPMSIAHLLRKRPDGGGARPLRDISRIAATDVDHYRFVPLKHSPATHRRCSRIKAAHADGPIESMRMCRSFCE